MYRRQVAAALRTYSTNRMPDSLADPLLIFRRNTA
jgi:hypothetical protein